MSEHHLSQLVEGTELQYVEQGDEILFTSTELGRQLGFSEPAKSVGVLFSRNKDELQHYSRTINLMGGDGKPRGTRVYTEEGVYLVTMLAKTDKAKAFRARVAVLLRSIREKRVAEARAQGVLDGVQFVRELTPLQKSILHRALGYRRKGLSYRDIGKLLDCSAYVIRHALTKAEVLGVVEA